ncbi:MAG: twin-arginine translocation signal domain-containing protein [Polyangiaceae bacterium]|nr:twin-arginine translocation signal domain-containing protein [Polyangiaceae bacterium]
MTKAQSTRGTYPPSRPTRRAFLGGLATLVGAALVSDHPEEGEPPPKAEARF